MLELAETVARHRSKLAPRWDDERALRNDRRIHARLARATERRRMLRVAGSGLVVAGIALVWSLGRETPAPVAVAPASVIAPTMDGAVALADGSTAVPFGVESEVRLLEDSPGLVRVALVRGSARFDVTHADRVYRVEAGDATVTVLGTSFVVSRSDTRVDVEVMRGRVRVDSPGGVRELGERESASFARASATGPAEAPSDAVPAAPATERLRSTSREATATPDPSWRSLARAGDEQGSWLALSSAGPDAIRDEPGDLLLAADVARHAGHADAAVTPLRGLLARHRSDPRAGLAAFTLGRVLLEDLGRPRDAAQAFADARTLDGAGELAEDALAREVEAWSRAGDTTHAEARASEYVALYPTGRRVASVRRHGGL